jgi:hypothetical protein
VILRRANDVFRPPFKRDEFEGLVLTSSRRRRQASRQIASSQGQRSVAFTADNSLVSIVTIS